MKKEGCKMELAAPALDWELFPLTFEAPVFTPCCLKDVDITEYYNCI